MTAIAPRPTRISTSPPAPGPALLPVPAARPPRMDHVDLVRGLVMVVMVLDHVRMFLTEVRFSPTDLSETSVPLFLTRWITHYCAPTFIFLAGASAWMAGTRRIGSDLSRFLVTRGLWLIVLEFSVVNFGWYFNLRFEHGAVAQVIWVIGISMVVLAGLVRLPRPVIVAVGLALVLGHNLLDGVTPAQAGAWAPLWRILHVQGALESAPLLVYYPVIPWIGVMALGYAAGPYGFLRRLHAVRKLALAGAGVVAAFVVLRALDVYGDPAPRLTAGAFETVAMSFLNVSKYPASLLYLLMTLGPALIALAAATRMHGKSPSALVVFGRVPFLFYVAHLYLVHAIAVGLAMLQGLPASAVTILPMTLPEGYGVGLPVIYAVWAGVVLVLYPVCARLARAKAQSRAWWWSYL